MEIIPIVLAFVGAYGVFLFLAYVLARIFFPTLEIEERENKPKRVRDRQPHKRFASR